MSRTLLAVLVGAAHVATFLAVPHSQAQPPGDEPRVARLVRELGADSFAVRSQASEELAKLGAAARREIEQATHSDDPEVRLRSKDLMRAIKLHDLWNASHVVCPATPVSASQVLRQLGEQTGNHVLVGDQFGTFHETEVQFDFAEADYWQALDDLCARSGNHCRPHYDSRLPGVVVVAGPPGRHPLAYAGPIRGRITSARRAFNEELSYEDARSEKTHTFQLNLEMTWEDRFKLVAYRSQLDVVEARTDSAVELAAAQPSSGGWNVVGSGTRQLTLNLRLNPPPASAQQLDVLRLSWGLIAVGDITHLEVDAQPSREPHFQDDVELVVDSLQPVSGGRYELAISVRRDLNLPEPQEILFQEHELDLLDAQGQPMRKLGQTNTLADHGATFKATFIGENENASPKKLRFTYPKLRSQRDLEIVFRKVPLPVGRPE